MNKKSKTFIRLLASKLIEVNKDIKKKSLKKAFKHVIDELPSGSLRSILHDNFTECFQLLKSKIRILKETHNSIGANDNYNNGEVGEERTTDDENDEHDIEKEKDVDLVHEKISITDSSYNFPYNFFRKKKGLQSKATTEQANQYYIQYLQHHSKPKSLINCVKDFQRYSNDKTILATLNKLLVLSSGLKDFSLIKKLLYVFLIKIQPLAEKHLEEKNTKKIVNLQDNLHKFLSVSQIRCSDVQSGSEEEKPFYKDLVASLLSLYLDLSLYLFSEEENKTKLSKLLFSFVSFMLVNHPEQIYDVLLQITHLKPDTVELVQPLIKFCLTQNINRSEAGLYIKYMVTVAMVNNLDIPDKHLFIDDIKRASTVVAPDDIIQWLNDRIPDIVDEQQLQVATLSQYLIYNMTDSLQSTLIDSLCDTEGLIDDEGEDDNDDKKDTEDKILIFQPDLSQFLNNDQIKKSNEESNIEEDSLFMIDRGSHSKKSQKVNETLSEDEENSSRQPYSSPFKKSASKNLNNDVKMINPKLNLISQLNQNKPDFKCNKILLANDMTLKSVDEDGESVTSMEWEGSNSDEEEEDMSEESLNGEMKTTKLQISPISEETLRLSILKNTTPKQIAIVTPRRSVLSQSDVQKQVSSPAFKSVSLVTSSKAQQSPPTNATQTDKSRSPRSYHSDNSLQSPSNSRNSLSTASPNLTSHSQDLKQSSKKTSSKSQTSKASTPKAPTPKVTTPKAPTPKATTPKAPTPKAATPKALTPKAATPKALTPKAATPKALTPKAATPKALTPKVTTPKATTPKVTTPKSTTQAKQSKSPLKTHIPHPTETGIISPTSKNESRNAVIKEKVFISDSENTDVEEITVKTRKRSTNMGIPDMSVHLAQNNKKQVQHLESESSATPRKSRRLSKITENGNSTVISKSSGDEQQTRNTPSNKNSLSKKSVESDSPNSPTIQKPTSAAFTKLKSVANEVSVESPKSSPFKPGKSLKTSGVKRTSIGSSCDAGNISFKSSRLSGKEMKTVLEVVQEDKQFESDILSIKSKNTPTAPSVMSSQKRKSISVLGIHEKKTPSKKTVSDSEVSLRLDANVPSESRVRTRRMSLSDSGLSPAKTRHSASVKDPLLQANPKKPQDLSPTAIPKTPVNKTSKTDSVSSESRLSLKKKTPPRKYSLRSR